LPRHYLTFPEAFILVYDPQDPSSLDLLSTLKADIDRNKDKKEVFIIVIANIHSHSKHHHHHHVKSPAGSPQKGPSSPNNASASSLDQVESILNRGNNWCAREKIKHYTVNAMERPSLYEPFIYLATKLHPPQTKSSFPQLRQLTGQKTSRTDS
jgi:NF-kappa-B inhibitor-interacting Ras-like protein